MANSYTTNPIVLDTFSSAIDLASQLGLPEHTPIHIKQIIWAQPTTAGHTALISDAASGNPIFSYTCITNNLGVEIWYDIDVDNLYIGASGVQSGKILITL